MFIKTTWDKNSAITAGKPYFVKDWQWIKGDDGSDLYTRGVGEPCAHLDYEGVWEEVVLGAPLGTSVTWRRR